MSGRAYSQKDPLLQKKAVPVRKCILQCADPTYGLLFLLNWPTFLHIAPG